MKTRNLAFVLLASLTLFLGSCKSEAEKKQELIFTIKENLCSDVTSLVKTSINSLTLGIGGTLYETLVSKAQQKQMFCDPITPLVVADLKEMDLVELEKISQSKSEKNKFILKTIVAHKDEVKKAYDTYQPELKKYFDLLFEYAAKTAQ
jgi:hypothetical protein